MLAHTHIPASGMSPTQSPPVVLNMTKANKDEKPAIDPIGTATHHLLEPLGLGIIAHIMEMANVAEESKSGPRTVVSGNSNNGIANGRVLNAGAEINVAKASTIKLDLRSDHDIIKSAKKEKSEQSMYKFGSNQGSMYESENARKRKAERKRLKR